MTAALISLRGVERRYRLAKNRYLPVLLGIDLDIEPGTFTALMGPSGSGKSTLMNIIGCLDHLDAGSYHLAGENVGDLGDNALSRIRGERIGFVFQFFHLLPQLDILANVALPLFYAGQSRSRRNAQAAASLERVHMEHRLRHRPNQLSGGEMQRVAIARALIGEPDLLIADEPTGNLDTKTGQEILDCFHQLHAEGTTILMVTHEPEVAEQAQRIIHMRDGLLQEGLFRHEEAPA